MIRNNVKALSESFFTKYETRVRRKEKDDFIERTKESFREIGYTDEEMMIQKSRFGGKNLIIGSPDADFLFTAHYDTPGRNGWIALPFAKIWGMGVASLVGMLIVLMLAWPGIILNLLGVNIEEHNVLRMILSFAFLIIFFLMFALKNPHNHNDNTSGCLGVYNIATLISENSSLKEKCAFVFFDMEEAGLLGSDAFAKWRRKQYPDKENSSVINLDCIGDGDYLVLASRKKPAALKERDAMTQFFHLKGFETIKKTSSMLGYLSDHAKFPNGIMLALLRRSKLGGLYIPNIHTSNDIVCDLDKIQRLSEVVVDYVIEKNLDIDDSP